MKFSGKLINQNVPTLIQAATCGTHLFSKPCLLQLLSFFTIQQNIQSLTPSTNSLQARDFHTQTHYKLRQTLQQIKRVHLIAGLGLYHFISPLALTTLQFLHTTLATDLAHHVDQPLNLTTMTSRSTTLSVRIPNRVYDYHIIWKLPDAKVRYRILNCSTHYTMNHCKIKAPL